MTGKGFMFGIYSQKPLGTSPGEYDSFLIHCCKPILTYLYAHERKKAIFYFSASILEWIEDRYPEFNMLINDMVKRKQIEMAAGGFYDPILTMLPLKDRSHQLEKSITYLRKRFGRRPKSCWITEQSWSPSLISTLHNCGIQNVLLPSYAMKASGARIEGEGGPRIISIQDFGKSLTVFPFCRCISEEQLTSCLQQFDPESPVAPKSGTLPVFMLDCDAITGGFEDQAEQTLLGCIARMYDSFESKGIPSVLPRDISEQKPFLPLGYIPAGWYREKAADSEVRQQPELLVLYPEMRSIFGKLCFSQKLPLAVRKEKTLRKAVEEEILKSESFGSFTSGANPGIYRNSLRKESYRHLIEAEKTAREKGLFSTSLSPYDLDLDGVDEFLYRGKNISAVVDPKGGSLSELDYLVTAWNYGDTFVAKEGEAEESFCRLDFAPVKQKSFTDLFLPSGTDLSAFRKYRSSQLVLTEQQVYDIERLDRGNKTLQFVTRTAVPFSDGGKNVLLNKSYALKMNSIEVELKLTNLDAKPMKLWFAQEHNLSFAFEGEQFYQMLSGSSENSRRVGGGLVILPGVEKVQIRDLYNKSLLTLSVDKACTLWKHVYQTRKEYRGISEDIYQHTVLMTIWDVCIEPGGCWQCLQDIRIEKLR